MNSKRALSFGDTLSGGDRTTKKDQIEANATVEGISIRIYPTPGGNVEIGDTTLRVTPSVRKEQTSTEENLIRFNGKPFVDGDIDVFTFDVSIPVEEDDTIVVDAVNPEGNGDFDFRANVEIDYRNGLQSVETL